VCMYEIPVRMHVGLFSAQGDSDTFIFTKGSHPPLKRLQRSPWACVSIEGPRIGA